MWFRVKTTLGWVKFKLFQPFSEEKRFWTCINTLTTEVYIGIFIKMLDQDFFQCCKILTRPRVYENFFMVKAFIKMQTLIDMLNNFPKSKSRENWYSFIKFEVETKYKVHFKQKSIGQKFKMASLSVKRSIACGYRNNTVFRICLNNFCRVVE